MLILLLSLQPLPIVAQTPEPEAATVRVSMIVVNQVNWMTEDEDGYDNRMDFYSSFWNVHFFPPWGMARTPVLEHRGWTKTKPVRQCLDGWATECPPHLIVAPHMMFIVSEFDWEYRHREWFRPICP